MDKQIRPIRITTNNGNRVSFKAVAWLLGIEANWAMAANPFYVDDPDLAEKVTDEQLQKLKVKYSYLSHVEKNAPEHASDGGGEATETTQETTEKRTRKPRVI